MVFNMNTPFIVQKQKTNLNNLTQNINKNNSQALSSSYDTLGVIWDTY